MSSDSGHRIRRGAGFAARAFLMLASLIAWDTSNPQIASADAEAPPAECSDASSDVSGFAKPRRYQPCNRPQPRPLTPGARCSNRAQRLLHSKVEKYCHAVRKCNPQLDRCEMIDKKVRNGYGCTNAREIMQGQCWRKGDPGYFDHMDELEKAYEHLQDCIALQDKRCPR